MDCSLRQCWPNRWNTTMKELSGGCLGLSLIISWSSQADHQLIPLKELWPTTVVHSSVWPLLLLLMLFLRLTAILRLLEIQQLWQCSAVCGRHNDRSHAARCANTSMTKWCVCPATALISPTFRMPVTWRIYVANFVSRVDDVLFISSTTLPALNLSFHAVIGLAGWARLLLPHIQTWLHIKK